MFILCDQENDQEKLKYLHTLKCLHTQPICGTIHAHRRTSVQTHTHLLHFLNLKHIRSSNATDADELRRSLLGDDHSLSQFLSSQLSLDSQRRLTHHFLHIPFPQSLLLCRHRCLRSYTLWVGADGSYSSPSIRALGERGDHRPLDCMCMCTV